MADPRWHGLLSTAGADDELHEILDWHFDPKTGSPFWLEIAEELDFDPRRDIAGVADLVRFPDISERLRSVRVEKLIPRGSEGVPFDVFDSGGTTGPPKRIVDATSRLGNADWCADVLRAHGFPERGNWLYVGPDGPHAVGRSVRRMAARLGGLFFAVDMDPRWVKKMIAQGRQDIAEEYVDHLMEQVRAIVETQDVKVLFITPPVLEALCARADLYDRLSKELGAILWAGTAASPETLRMTEEELFPGTVVRGIYGNTLMGIAPQRRKEDGDAYPCVFRPYNPTSVVQVVDPETGRSVEYGERGRVRMHLLFRDMFLPNILERDSAVRIRPSEGDVVDGIADVLPVSPDEIIEGVY